MSSLPSEFMSRLKEIIPQDNLTKVLESFHIGKNVGIRCNSLSQDPEKSLQQLDQIHIPFKKISWNQHTYTIPAEYKSQLSHHDLTNLGHIAIQNLSSIWAVLALDPKPHEDILDLTAAPGSKTALIAECMQNTGNISACEKSKNRFYKLNNYLKQLNIKNCKTYLKDSRLVWKHCAERFDRVLCDVPCSSESRFQLDDPDSYHYWSLRKIKQLSHTQKGLLESAYRCLKPGGVLVYSTCTFAPEKTKLKLIDY